jgi:hypothetical protein
MTYPELEHKQSVGLRELSELTGVGKQAGTRTQHAPRQTFCYRAVNRTAGSILTAISVSLSPRFSVLLEYSSFPVVEKQWTNDTITLLQANL